MTLYTGMLWLRRPSDKPEVALAEAVAYAEEKYGRPVRLIARPADEGMPETWQHPQTGRAIPVRPDDRVLSSHLYLVTGTIDGGEDGLGR